MKNMLEKLREFPPKRILIIIAIASTITTIALFLEMRRIDALLMRSGYGIVDFELAFKQEKVVEIFTDWGSSLMELAQKSIIIDFGFILSYVFCFSSLTLLLTKIIKGKLQFLGLMVSILPFIAGFLDIIENLSLLNLIVIFEVLNTSHPWCPRTPRGFDIIYFPYEDTYHYISLAGICASLKFLLLGIVFLFIVLGGGYALFRKFKSI